MEAVGWSIAGGENIVTSLPGVCKIGCSDSQMDKQIVAPWRDCSTYLCLFLLPSPPTCLLQEGNIQTPVLKSTPGHIGSVSFHSCVTFLALSCLNALVFQLFTVTVKHYYVTPTLCSATTSRYGSLLLLATTVFLKVLTAPDFLSWWLAD